MECLVFFQSKNSYVLCPKRLKVEHYMSFIIDVTKIRYDTYTFGSGKDYWLKRGILEG
jgi:hypothetical protein